MQYTDFDDPRLSVFIHQILALSKTELVVLVHPTTILTQAFTSALRSCVKALPAAPGFVLVGDGEVVHTRDPGVFAQPKWFSSLLQPCAACSRAPGGGDQVANATAPCGACGAVHNATVLAFTKSVFHEQVL